MALCAGSIPAWLVADVIELTTGQRVEGEVLKETNETLFVDIGIDVVSSAQVAVRDNRLVAVTAPNYTDLGAGIAVSSPVGGFVIAGNEVSRVPEYDAEEAKKTVDARWLPLLVRGGRPPAADLELMRRDTMQPEMSGGMGMLALMTEIELKVRQGLGLPSTAPALKVVEGGSKEAAAAPAKPDSAAAKSPAPAAAPAATPAKKSRAGK